MKTQILKPACVENAANLPEKANRIEGIFLWRVAAPEKIIAQHASQSSA